MSVATTGKRAFHLFLFGVVALILSLMISVPGRAQVSGATISGSVMDTSGAVIPQAQIDTRNVATGVVTTAMSNSDGFYSVSNILPGTYQISVSKQGFKSQVRPSVALEVGANQVLNIVLE